MINELINQIRHDTFNTFLDEIVNFQDSPYAIYFQLTRDNEFCVQIFAS